MAPSSRLAEAQRRALDRLRQRTELTDFYLAGGSALTLHLGHRTSLDLDFFSISASADLSRVQRAAENTFENVQVIAKSDVSIQMLADGCRLDFVCYPYEPLEPLRHVEGVAVASLRDLGTMKLAALAKRGLRRDFWDLFEIIRRGGYPLRELGKAYVEKFGLRESDLYHVLKALTYFDDAERDPSLPAGMTEALWEQIKVYFRAEAPKLLLDRG